MISIFTTNVPKNRQYQISLAVVFAASAMGYLAAPLAGYRVVALILLLAVSLVAMVFDIVPVLISAIVSAFIWNFFFIPPRFSLDVLSTDDIILVIMYFVIASVNAALTYKIRKAEKIARKKEEKANVLRLYDTFLNSLSHELRTPVATIISATDNLMLTNDRLCRDDREELIIEISKASFRLNQQVENLLNMSRLGSGFVKPKLDWLDVNELVYTLIAKVEENRACQKISIQIDPHLPLIKSDKFMLEQIIYNLISNACLYTPPQTTVIISARINADSLELVVEDNGPGFPVAEIANVFERFYRLKNSPAGGTGLGLSIVKGFAEALSGGVVLENLPAGGSRFTVQVACEVTSLKAVL